MQATYKVPEANLDTLRARLAKLARRCKRIKVAEPILTVGSFEDVRYIERDEINGDRERIRRVYTVTLDSPERPKIEGFEFVAVISPVTDEDGKHLGNILRAVPGTGIEIPERFREASNNCDHCHTQRFRLETFVIASLDGFKQVGRNCLANYLGLTNPHMLAELAQILIDAHDLMGMAEDSGGSFGGGRTLERIAVEDVLQTAASAIRLYGWLSRQSARQFEKQSTSDRVFNWIMGNSKTREQFEYPLVITEEDKKLAAETEEWLETLIGTSPSNDYLYNLSLLAQAVSVTPKNFGLLVSAISAYSREKEREIRRNKRFEDDKNSQYIGTIGERITIKNLTVLFHTTFPSDYGVIQFYKMKDETGNVVVYSASRTMQTAEGTDWEAGTVIPELITRVKSQEEREGVKQTKITRASLPKVSKVKLPLTAEQKQIKKGIAKLKRIHRTLPTYAQVNNDRDRRPDDGQRWEYEDYQAWGTIGKLLWELQCEPKI